jgi:hypothetical protein
VLASSEVFGRKGLLLRPIKIFVPKFMRISSRSQGIDVPARDYSLGMGASSRRDFLVFNIR